MEMDRWRKRLGRGGVALGLLVLGVLLVWWGLKRWRVEQAVESTRRALMAGEMEEAVSGMRLLRAHEEDHPLLPVFRAQFYSRYAPHLAPPFWEEALARHPEEWEFRTAYALNLVETGALEMAGKRVRGWLEEAPEASAHLKAALAVAFAQGEMEWARDLAGRLEEQEPGSKINRINRAALDLSVGGGPEQADAVESLTALLDDPEVGLQALRLLLRYAVRGADAVRLEELQSRAPGGDPAVDMLFLEAAGQMGQAPDRRLVERVWNGTEPGSLERSRLGGWLVNRGRGDWLIDLAEQEPEDRRWHFPVGLALAEAHVQTGQINEALDGLAEVRWPGLEYLRVFVRARLAADISGEASETFLALALDKSGDRSAPWTHLFETARSWGWREGMVAVARHVVGKTAVDSPRFPVWMDQVMALRDAEGLLLASERFLEQHPDHVPSLNNAAYAAFLLRRDLGQALDRARRAYELSPQFAGVRSTLAFLEMEQGDLARAERLLEKMPEDDPHRWLGQLYLMRKRGASLPPGLREAVSRHRYFWPEEEEWKAELSHF